MAEAFQIVEGDEVAAQELEAELLASLWQVLPQSTNTGFVLVAKDAADALIGGVIGSTSYGWLLVKVLWVRDDYRGTGLGRKLMEQAESRALQLDCHSAWLDTSNPLAMQFYEKLGYEVFGQLANGPEQYPPEHCRWFMQKSLVGYDE